MQVPVLAKHLDIFDVPRQRDQPCLAQFTDQPARHILMARTVYVPALRFRTTAPIAKTPHTR